MCTILTVANNRDRCLKPSNEGDVNILEQAVHDTIVLSFKGHSSHLDSTEKTHYQKENLDLICRTMILRSAPSSHSYPCAFPTSLPSCSDLGCIEKTYRLCMGRSAYAPCQRPPKMVTFNNPYRNKTSVRLNQERLQHPSY